MKVPAQRIPFDQYRIWLRTGRKHPGVIECLQGGRVVGMLVFTNEDHECHDELGFPSLFYPPNQLQVMIDLLRNEAPLHIEWHSDAGAVVTSDPEPVGEGEMISRVALENVVS